jgi:predicted nucleic acid-binding protein
MQRPPLVAIDTNFPILLADGDDDALDALSIVRSRMRAAEILVSPTVQLELAFKSRNEPDAEARRISQLALAGLRSRWNLRPATLNSVQEGIADEAARRTRHAGLIAYEEWNDALIIAESAVLNAVLLVSNDSHLLQMDHRRLGLLFRELDLPVPLIVSPREIVSKFYR